MILRDGRASRACLGRSLTLSLSTVLAQTIVVALAQSRRMNLVRRSGAGERNGMLKSRVLGAQARRDGRACARVARRIPAHSLRVRVVCCTLLQQRRAVRHDLRHGSTRDGRRSMSRLVLRTSCAREHADACACGRCGRRDGHRGALKDEQQRRQEGGVESHSGNLAAVSSGIEGGEERHGAHLFYFATNPDASGLGGERMRWRTRKGGELLVGLASLLFRRSFKGRGRSSGEKKDRIAHTSRKEIAIPLTLDGVVVVDGM